MMKAVAILSKYFRRDDESLTEFAAELKKLSPAEKAELAAGAAAVLGVELDPA